MNRSDRYRCVFLHVPRTGGSSIESLDWWDRWTGHFPAAAEMDFPHGYLSFAFVRNPWDRFVSLYHYLAAMTPRHCWHRANADLAAGVRRMGSFAEFCRGFGDWPHRHNFHFRPQSRWVTDAAGNLLADFLGCFERLQHDFGRLCRRLGAPATELPKLNASPHRPFRQYYDRQTRKIVAELWHEDLAAFGYTWQGT